MKNNRKKRLNWSGILLSALVGGISGVILALSAAKEGHCPPTVLPYAAAYGVVVAVAHYFILSVHP